MTDEPIRVAFAKVPDALKGDRKKRYCVWRAVKKHDGTVAKVPYTPTGGKGSTSDKATWCRLGEAVEAFKAGTFKFTGIGIHLLGQERLAVIDLDRCRDPDTGELEDWAQEIVERAGSYTEVSPSGTGVHVIGRVPKGFRSVHTSKKLNGADQHVDLFAACDTGRYITLTGVPVEGSPVEVADISALIDEIDPPQAAEEDDPWPDDEEPSTNGSRQTELSPDLLDLVSTPAPEGERSEKFFHAVGWLKDLGWTPEQILELMESHPGGPGPEKYGDRLEAEIRRAWGKAETRPAGKPATEWHEMSPSAVIDYLNERHFIVREGSKVLVYSPRHDVAYGRQVIDAMTTSEFQKLYANRLVNIGTKNDPKRVRWGPFWLTSEIRRQYLGGVVCDPSGRAATAGVYNLWRGFAVEPQEGNWTLMRKHIRDIVCSGDPRLFDYTMLWLANVAQHPERQGEVAFVMIGGRGTGKGCFARWVKRMFGQHGVHISNPKHLVGNFNAHLRDCILLFVDEAFFAGDKQHASILKAIITEPTLMAEAKFRDAVEVRNLLHVMMASNETWTVPAGVDERRFFVLRVSAERQNDHAYFAAIEEQMEDGGLAAMLHDLLAYDLSGKNVRAVPNTAALTENKVWSLQPPEAWLLDVLHRQVVYGKEKRDRPDPETVLYIQSPNIISKEDAYADFQQFQKQYRSYAMPSNVFWKELAKIEDDAFTTTTRPTVDGERIRCVAWPAVEDARAIFERHIRGEIDWS